MVAPLHSRDANAHGQDAPDTHDGGVQKTHAAARLTPSGHAHADATSGACPPVLHDAKFAPGTDSAPCKGERAFTGQARNSAPFQRHSGTSKAAAAAIIRAMPELRQHVYVAIAMGGERGMTDEEIADFIPMNPSTVRPRRGELERDGWLTKAAFTRPTKSDRSATVWIANEEPASFGDAESTDAHAGVYPASRGVTLDDVPPPPAAPCAPDTAGQSTAAATPAQIDFTALLSQLQERE